MSEGIRLYAAVGPPTDYPPVRHLVGLPPELEGEEDDARERLPWPKVIIVETNPDAGVTLLRLALGGAFAGDTWHPSVEEAKEQASYEFGASLGEWQEIPQDVSNAGDYALAQIS